MDVDLPDITGIEAARRIVAARPDINIVTLALHRDKRYIGEMLKAGAVGYLLKDCTHEILLEAIRAVYSGERFICKPVLDSIIIEYLDHFAISKTVKPSVLITRELEILGSLADGLSTKEVARSFGLSIKTVETHRHRISDKLSMRSVAEPTKYAIREGISVLESNASLQSGSSGG